MRDACVFVSTGAFNSRILRDILDEAAAGGYRHIELSSGVAPHPGNVDLARRCKDEFNLLVHNYFPPPAEPFVLNLASVDGETLARSRTHCRDAIALAADLGGDIYTVHGGFAALPRVDQLGRPFEGSRVIPRETAFAIFTESVRGLVEYGAGLGVRFVVENNVVAPFNLTDGRNDLFLCVEAEEMVALADEVGSPWFGYLVDVGHLRVSARSLGFDRIQWLERIAPWIRGFHLSDNDGTADSNKPFGPDAWFLPHLSRHADALIVVEAYRLTRHQLEGCLNAVHRSIAA